MTLRRRILLIIAVTLVALILGLYKVSSSILVADFSQLERCDVERAGGLPHQLLAFSRKQALQPRVLGLSNIVTDIEKMLRRLIGEDIELHTVRAAAVGNVRADPAQIEQVIVNLAVNAPDAMPNGGKLILEVARATLGNDCSRLHDDVEPGECVLLSVTNTGTGYQRGESHSWENPLRPKFWHGECGKYLMDRSRCLSIG